MNLRGWMSDTLSCVGVCVWLLEWSQNSWSNLMCCYRMFHGGRLGKSCSAPWSLAMTHNTVSETTINMSSGIFDIQYVQLLRGHKWSDSQCVDRKSPHPGGAERALPWTGCLWDSVHRWTSGANAESAVAQHSPHLLLIQVAPSWPREVPTAFLHDTGVCSDMYSVTQSAAWRFVNPTTSIPA